MKFKTASKIEETVWTMKLAHVTRGQNRALINDLFNGSPPYSDEEQTENHYDTNVNFLEGTTIAQSARTQWENAFLNTSNFFKVELACGPVYKRKAWQGTITKELNRQLKRSLAFVETLRSTFASVVLHGIGPTSWEDPERAMPMPLGIEDVLMPSRSLLTMENVEYFAIYREYTPARLWRLTHGYRVDPGWNIPVVEAAVKDMTKQVMKFEPPNANFVDLWTPEKISEDMKEDSGFFAGDAVPTQPCWDFFFYNDDNKKAGWNRRIIPDTPINSGKKPAFNGQFLYDPGNRLYAKSLGEIIHFQFGDASAVAPFRYHSVRSLGFLLYAVCHLQNRLRCRFNDHLFTQLIELFRVRSPEDFAKITKIDLVNKGVIEEGINWVPAGERYNINAPLIEAGFAQNRQTMTENASSYRESPEYGKTAKEETATSVMARVNSATQLVTSMLSRGYNYATFQYREIARRFCIKNSKDKVVRDFRNACLKAGVPEDYLNVDMWDIEPERVMGGGNRMLETAQAKELMAARNFFDPDAQRGILHDFTRAITGDPDRADAYVPMGGKVISDSIHDAELSMAPLMMGLPVRLKAGINHIEYVETLLGELSIVMATAMKRGMLSEREISGVPSVADHIMQHIEIIAQDKNEKERVKAYQEDLGKIMNEYRAMTQQMNQKLNAMAKEAGKQGGNGQGGITPEAQAKIAATMMQAKAKMETTKISHAQRTTQRQASWELEERRKDAQHAMDLRRQQAELQADVAAKDLETEANIRTTVKKNRMKSTEE